MNAFEQVIMGVPDDELFNLYRAGSAMKPSHVQGTPVASHTPMPVKTDKQVRQDLLNRMFPKEQTEATEQGLKYMTMGLSEAPLNQLEDIVAMNTAESEAERKAAEERYLASIGQNIAGMAGTFAGVKAKNAPLGMLKKAEAMKAAGVPDRQIWKDTGWTFGFADGKPRFEIDDSGMQIRLDQLANYMPEYGSGGGSGRIHDLISHKELAKHYPADFGRGVKDHQVMNPKAYLGVFPGQPVRGSFELVSGINAEAPTVSGLKSTTLHELQHAVQSKEGFAKGGSPEAFMAADMAEATRLRRLIKENDQLVEQYKSEGNSKAVENIRSDTTSLKQELDDLISGSKSSEERYQSLAGEAESRLTQKRTDLTPEQRRAQYPIDQFDVPVDQQIVRFGESTSTLSSPELAHVPKEELITAAGKRLGIAEEPKDMLQFPKGDSYGIQNDGARLNGDVLNTVADSAYQTAVPGPSAVNNQKVSLRQPENAKKWLGDRDLVTLSGVDINNPQPGAILVHSAQAPGLDVWNTSKADPSTYSGLNKSKSFWGASEEGAVLHQQDRASAGDNLEVGQYIIRADNPVAIPFQGSRKTQDALIAAREAGHDVAILYDNQGNRNVVHLKPEQGGVKNVKNTGEWSESPSMLHGLAATVGLSIPLVNEYLAADEKKKRLMESRSDKFKKLKEIQNASQN